MVCGFLSGEDCEYLDSEILSPGTHEGKALATALLVGLTELPVCSHESTCLEVVPAWLAWELESLWTLANAARGARVSQNPGPLDTGSVLSGGNLNSFSLLKIDAWF